MMRIAPFALALAGAASAQAQVYKCVDPGGKVIYSQTPCPSNTTSGKITRRVDAAPAASAAAAPADKAAKSDAAKGDAAKKSGPKTVLEQEQEFRKRQQDQAKAEKEAAQKTAEAQRKEEYCRNARERLATYESGTRIVRFNAQGERYYVDDAQVEQEKAKARADAAQSCN